MSESKDSIFGGGIKGNSWMQLFPYLVRHAWRVT